MTTLLPPHTHQPLTAPFPYHGGKSRAAPEVWRRFGPVHSLIELFGGSLAVLLGCPWGQRPREIANDIDGLVVNFFRAVRGDPERAAYYADWPTTHLDLIARKRYCLERLAELQERLAADDEYFDAKIAGYWVWCVSNDIGLFSEGSASIPLIDHTDGGRGVKARVDAPGGDASSKMPRLGCNGIPHVHATDGARGVAAQRIGGMPHVRSNSQDGGEGVNAQRGSIPHVMSDPTVQGVQAAVPRLAPGNTGAEPCSGERLLPMFYALRDRLYKTYHLCKDWSTLCSPSVMGLTPSDLDGGKDLICGIFLDPPYATQGRGGNIYRADSLTIALDVQQWAIKMAADPKLGPYLRIAVCGYKNDYAPWPEGWDAYEWRWSQVRMNGKAAEYDRTEVIWFSPSCLTTPAVEAKTQQNFFDLVG